MFPPSSGQCCARLASWLLWMTALLPCPSLSPPVFLGYYETCLSTLEECLSTQVPGHYPMCGDCSRFFKCDVTTSSAAVIQCPTSLLYDVTLGVCNYAYAVRCSSTTSITTVARITGTTTSMVTNPTSNPTTNPTSNPMTNPKTNHTTMVTNSTTNPTTMATNPTTNPTTNPKTNPMTNRTTMVTNPTTYPMTDPTTNPTTNSITNPTTMVKNPMTDPTTTPTSKVTNPTTNPMTNPTTNPTSMVTNPTTNPTTITRAMATPPSPVTTSTTGLSGRRAVCNPCPAVDGFYVTCNACSVYYLCREGRVRGFLLCPGGLVWDDVSQRCQLTTANCPRPFS